MPRPCRRRLRSRRPLAPAAPDADPRPVSRVGRWPAGHRVRRAGSSPRRRRSSTSASPTRWGSSTATSTRRPPWPSTRAARSRCGNRCTPRSTSGAAPRPTVRVANRCVLTANLGFDAGASAVVAPISFDLAAPLLPPPSITVTPATDLVDRQVVQVEGHGFVRGESHATIPRKGARTVNLYQCGGGEYGVPGDCRLHPTRTVDVGPDGTFSAELPVTTAMHSLDGGTFDCRTASCFLVASTGQPHFWLHARADLHFDPDAPSPDWPRPEVKVSPSSRLQDVNQLSVVGTGFTPGSEVNVEVCRGGSFPAVQLRNHRTSRRQRQWTPTGGDHGHVRGHPVGTVRLPPAAGLRAAGDGARSRGDGVGAARLRTTRRLARPLPRPRVSQRCRSTAMWCTGTRSTSAAARSSSSSTSSGLWATPPPAVRPWCGCTAGSSPAATSRPCGTRHVRSPSAATWASRCSTACAARPAAGTTSTWPASTPTTTQSQASSGCRPTPPSTASTRTPSPPEASLPAR